MTDTDWRALADAVLVLHFAVVVFVIGGLVAVLVGQRAGWRWVANPVFRTLHVAAIGVVVAQAWLGALCPLTVLENDLRARAGAAGYDAGFIEHWVSRLLFHEAPAWVFVAAYTVFGALVVVAWWRCPPRWRRR